MGQSLVLMIFNHLSTGIPIGAIILVPSRYQSGQTASLKIFVYYLTNVCLL